MASKTETERRLQEEVNKILSALSAVDDKIDDIIKIVATTKETSPVFWNNIHDRIREAYEDAREITKEFLIKDISDMYSDKIKEELTRLKQKELISPTAIDFKDFITQETAKESLKNLLAETVDTMASGFNSGEQSIRHLANLTQQLLLSEKQVEEAIASGFTGAGSALASKRKLKNALLEKALDGKYVKLIDKNGNVEEWQVKTYAELVVRVKLQEASAQAVINTAIEVGSDLVQVSVHNSMCAICAPHEGRIYSLSGKDSRFPPAVELPPHHPNCQHSLTVVIEEALEAAGLLDKYSEFSKSKDPDAEHPTRAGYIPLSERELA